MPPQYDDEFDEKPETKQLGDADLFESPDEDLTTDIPLTTPCIMFFLPSQREPIKLEHIGLIILGRRDPRRNFTPTIDFAPHHGATLGVSRKHAKIFFNAGAFHITDMGSTNGTWVNDKEVGTNEAVRLKTGDLLRLGHLIIYIGGCGGTS